MQKQGHLLSWYWGGTGGGIITLMALIAAKGIRSDIASGAVILLAGEAAAFLIVLVTWSVRQTKPKV